MRLSFSVSPAWRVLNLSEYEILARHRECGFRYFCDEMDSPISQALSTAALSKEKLSIAQDAGVQPIKVRVHHETELKALYRAIEYTASLGVNKLVVPLITNEKWTRAEYTRANAEYLQSLSKAAKANGVGLLIEHVGDYQLPHYAHSSMELMNLLEKVETDNIAFNLNIANAGLTDLALYPEIHLLGTKILSVDASDHFFAMALGHDKERENLGLAPLMGFLDYDEIMRGLKEAASAEEFNIRLNYPRVFEKKSAFVPSPKLDRFPLPLLQQFTRWTLNVCKYMLATYAIKEDAE